MRIIGGQFRGRQLTTLDGPSTRPTSDRVRESIFNILQLRIPDAIILDLFSGSGAMSIEALSRGAHAAVLIDSSPAACRIIQKNLDLLGLSPPRARLIQSDWRQALSQNKLSAFDIVFLDPPYDLHSAYQDAPTALNRMGCIHQNTILVIEHRTKTDVPITLEPPFEIYDQRRYGETTISLARLQP